MKCPICNGKGYQFVCDYDGMYDIVCEQCKGKGEVDENGKPIFTNEEYLKSLGTEQLAEFLADTINEIIDGIAYEMQEGVFDQDDFYQTKHCWVEWLKQPHKE